MKKNSTSTTITTGVTPVTPVTPVYDLQVPVECKRDVQRALDSNWIGVYGDYLDTVAGQMCKLLNVKHSLLTQSGTAAGHCMLLALKFRYPQIKKVYVCNHVFVAAWTVVRQVYPDRQIEVLKTDPQTLNVDIEFLVGHCELGAAVVLVHNLGNIIDTPALKRRRPDLVFLEDNCEGFMGRYPNGQCAGTACFASSVSFFANKTITCGQGGCFLTRDTAAFQHVLQLVNQGMDPRRRYVHPVHGYNYRMTNIQAAMLRFQLDNCAWILRRKREIFERYRQAFRRGSPRLRVQRSQSHSCWFTCVCVPGHTYADLRKRLLDDGIETRPMFYPIKAHAFLKDIKTNESCIDAGWVLLPSYRHIDDDEIDRIIRCVKQLLIR